MSIPWKRQRFLALTVDQRLQHARNLHLCFNCLSAHQFADCRSTQTCRSDGCDKKHHTLLHKDYNSINSKSALDSLQEEERRLDKLQFQHPEIEIIRSHTDTSNNHFVWKRSCTCLRHVRLCQQTDFA